MKLPQIKDKMENIKETLKSASVKKIIEWLKSPRETNVSIQKKDKFGEYILKDSVEKLGAVDFDGDKIITRDGKKYLVYRFSFVTPIGVDDQVDAYNKDALHQFVSALEHDFKVCYVDENKNLLENNIKFFERRLEKTDNPKLRALIEEEIRVMHLFNVEKSTSTILYISEEDISMMEKNADGLILEKYDLEQSMQLFRQLNNEMG